MSIRRSKAAESILTAVEQGLSVRRGRAPFVMTRQQAEQCANPEASSYCIEPGCKQRRRKTQRRCDEHCREHQRRQRQTALSKFVGCYVPPHVKEELRIGARMNGLTLARHVGTILTAIIDARGPIS